MAVNPQMGKKPCFYIRVISNVTVVQSEAESWKTTKNCNNFLYINRWIKMTYAIATSRNRSGNGKLSKTRNPACAFSRFWSVCTRNRANIRYSRCKTVINDRCGKFKCNQLVYKWIWPPGLPCYLIIIISSGSESHCVNKRTQRGRWVKNGRRNDISDEETPALDACAAGTLVFYYSLLTNPF